MDENTIKLFGSRETDNWQTPRDLYCQLDGQFGFDFDPCPYPRPEGFDGLKSKWGKRNFVNPPYSMVREFLEKAHEDLDVGNVLIRKNKRWGEDK